MTTRTEDEQGYRFLVAFSFAGPHRDKVRAIAELVADRLGRERVFFDEWYEHEILGSDMDVLLQRFYAKRSLFVVADVSQEYGDRQWCRAEAKAIRELRFTIDTASDEVQRLRLLDVRFGPGEVPGVFLTTGYVDGVDKSPPQCADVILKRLALIQDRLARADSGATSPPTLAESPDRRPLSWPEICPSFPTWPMANHTEARAEFERLITRDAPWRSLFLRGTSETGKSHITRQMLANAIQIPDLACGRFDFKGTTDVEEELRVFVEYLEVPLPDGKTLNECLRRIVDGLRQRSKPVLLVFDTYEGAGEAANWVEKELLLRVMRDTCFRVVVAGQRVPDSYRAVWAAAARPVLQLTAPGPEEWLHYSKPHRPDVTLDFVRQAHQLCGGKVSVLAQLLGPAS